MLHEQLGRVRERIRNACQRCGRNPASITLVCVTKGIPSEAIQQVLELGVRDLGENRVQEAREKRLALGWGAGAQLKSGSGLWAGGSGSLSEPRAQSPQPIRWHLIGHLQRNKAKQAVELFETIHSVDSVELAKELERHAAVRVRGSGLRAQSPERRLEVFVQVNVSREATKFGCVPDEALQLAAGIASLPHLQLKGLMTIAPYVDHLEMVRPVFRQLRELRDQLAVTLSPEPAALSLSMGMSHDFEVAIEEGADVVRIGTAIFGAQHA